MVFIILKADEIFRKISYYNTQFISKINKNKPYLKEINLLNNIYYFKKSM